MGDFERLIDGYIQRNNEQFFLTIQRDGVVKYCCFYTAEPNVNTMYWISPEDERMACPFSFWSYKQAEWFFHQWRVHTGQEGWHFDIKRRSHDTERKGFKASV